ncbi:MAG TPA: glycoside hydrolase family 99-like domain-containing protein, partial [Pseudoxanthomonas sp.]|nr:glycoside hydrolase family 99-like domain-containing protein [Pseudoxanthomonas sp.]
MPLSTRDRLRQRFLDRYSSLVPPAPRGQPPTDGARVRRPYVRSDERAIGYVPYSKGELPDPLPATLVAFYLPQFHTIPENDEWWGKGFTEWRNVTRALPQFEGHHQPRLPGDLGFYDLRNVEVMREQARLAKEYGIGAFCFYFYWFGGKTLLETPLRNWLNDPTIDFPFCLCWANEKWTRTWDGRGDEILIDQRHSPEDEIAFIKYIADYFRDPRYLRVGGNPLLLIYRPQSLPNALASSHRWREWCRLNKIGELHIAYVESFERPVPKQIGFDSAVEFPPNLMSLGSCATRHVLIN